MESNMIDTTKLSNENILFKNFTSATGEFSEYLAGKSFAKLFNLNRVFAAKVTRFAVRNNYPMVDAIMIQQYQMCEANKKKDQECPLEAEQAQIDNDNYMEACGLTPGGRDWMEC
tara:strand:- start:270 stop:614 length:345 start_codon:yes stop_codon:yes gene_type:complete